jgi:UDP-sugar transporter A1/2/3
LALQNAFLTIIMHYSRISTSPSRSYSAASAVLLNELLKGSISLMTALKRIDNEMTKEESHLRSPVVKSRTGTPNMSDHHQGSMLSSPRTGKAEVARNFVSAYFRADRWKRLSREIFSPDCWKLSIPAILYVIQNNLQYTAASNLDVATFQVTYQMKILTTAFFSVFMLGKRLSTSKWLALLLLAAGVGIVQIQTGSGAGSSHASSIVKKVEELAAESDIVAAVSGAVHEMSPFKGFVAVCAACVTSGLAGVYFEMVLKGSKADLWVRNAQLSLFSLVPALLPILLGSATSNSGGGLTGILLEPFKNFSAWAWGTVVTQVLGGLITALVIKYSDNILKGFATSLSIILSSMASVFLFNYHITPAFVMGSSIVLSATFMYNQPATNKPNPLVAGLAHKIAEATGGKVDPSSSRSRTSVAVPGSPIPANAPIIGETPKPSRSSSMVSLLGLGQSLSRAPTPSQFNGQSRTTTPYLTAHATPNVLSPYGSTQNLTALGTNRPPPLQPLSRASSNYSIRSVSGSETSPGFGSLQSFTPSTSPTSARDRKQSGRHRPVLEVNTDVEIKTR